MSVDIYLVFILARQINGEYVFLKGEKGFYSEHSANEMIKDFINQYGSNGQQTVVKLETPHGQADCHCEIGVFKTPIELPVTIVYVIAVAARQIDGEFFSTNVDKAFNNKEDADRHANIVRNKYTQHGKSIPTKISTPQGEMECMCEVGVFEMEIQ